MIICLLSRSRTHAANLQEQIRREQETSRALSEQLNETYADLKKVYRLFSLPFDIVIFNAVIVFSIVATLRLSRRSGSCI